jgi:hypothetical protein
MLCVVGVGMIGIMLDISLILLIPTTILVGLLVLVVTGSIRVSRRRTETPRDSTPSGTAVTPDKELVWGSETAPRVYRDRGSRWRRYLEAIGSSLTRLVRRETISADPKEKVKQIDQMLDTLMAEPPVLPPLSPARQTTSPPAPASGLGLAPLRELSTAQLQDDLLVPDLTEDAAEPAPGSSSTPLTEASRAKNEPPKKEISVLSNTEDS